MDPRIGPAPQSPVPTNSELDEMDKLVHAGLNQEQITQTLQQTDQHNGQMPRTPKRIGRILAAGHSRAQNMALHNTVADAIAMFGSAPTSEEPPAILAAERFSHAPPHVPSAAKQVRPVPEYEASFGATGWKTWDAASAIQSGTPEHPPTAREHLTAREARILLKQRQKELSEARKARSKPSAISEAQTKHYEQLEPKEKVKRAGWRSNMTPEERSKRLGWRSDMTPEERSERGGWKSNMTPEERSKRLGRSAEGDRSQDPRRNRDVGR